MKHEVVIPKRIKIGGFDYSVVMNIETDKELHSDDDKGQCSSRLRRLSIRSDMTPLEISQTFIHEVLHGVDGVYDNYHMTEDTVAAVSNGLIQVFEQLGIRFVRR